MVEKIFYSKSKRGFYHQGIGSGNDQPSDCMEISQEYFMEMLNGQLDGFEVLPDAQGLPMLQKPTTIDLDGLMTIVSENAKKCINGGIEAYGAWFPTDRMSRSIYQSIAGSVPQGFQVRSLDNGMIIVNTEKINQILELIKDLDINTYLNLSKLQSELIESSSLEDIDLYSGWPARYIEGA